MMDYRLAAFPCVDATSDLFTFKYFFICSDNYSADSCVPRKNCVWDEDESTCDPDLGRIYLGNPEQELDEALAKVNQTIGMFVH